MDGTYKRSVPKQRTIIQITKESDEERVPTRTDRMERKSVQDEPMDDVEEPIQNIDMDAVEPTQGARLNMLLPSAEHLKLTEYRSA